METETIPSIEIIEKRLRKAVWNLQEEFNLIEAGDKVMACLSGGKDSYTMVEMLIHLQKVMNNSFDLVVVNLDQKQPGFPEEILPNYLTQRGVKFRILERDTYSIVKEKVPEGKTMCSLCSRLRRGTIYTAADEMGVTKIALGHHREDILETFFLNLFFNGKTETMPAKYRTDDKRHVVIRPLAYCKEKDIEVYARHKQFPIIPCNLCGSQDNLQRNVVRRMIDAWDETYPNRSEIMFTALKNIHTSHLFDKSKYDFNLME
ncbi:MAG: tRNA 2-thiocytidine(32) synthetase TtcA [Bacteroidia bacterium]|nr:tRNA 2-thiocytidine(32) synthetase TtcA [Bacteroidia bacterium]